MHDSDKKVILLHLLLKTESGKMLEWLKRHAWKACKRLKRFTGSNPVLSANKKEVYQNSGSSSFSYYFLKQSLDFHKPGLCHITKI